MTRKTRQGEERQDQDKGKRRQTKQNESRQDKTITRQDRHKCKIITTKERGREEKARQDKTRQDKTR